jgi:hypothetical protein
LWQLKYRRFVHYLTAQVCGVRNCTDPRYSPDKYSRANPDRDGLSGAPQRTPPSISTHHTSENDHYRRYTGYAVVCVYRAGLDVPRIVERMICLIPSKVHRIDDNPGGRKGPHRVQPQTTAVQYEPAQCSDKSGHCKHDRKVIDQQMNVWPG